MDDRQFDLADDLELVLEQEVVVAVNGAADRVLDWQDAEGGLAALDRVEDVLEAGTGQERGVGGNRCAAASL